MIVVIIIIKTSKTLLIRMHVKGYNNGQSNHQKVMKQVTKHKIPCMYITTEAMTTAHLLQFYVSDR